MEDRNLSQATHAAVDPAPSFAALNALQDGALADCPFVSSCRGEAKRAGGIQVHAAAGETIFSERDESDSLVRLDEGLVRCFRVTADGRRLVSRFAWPGSFLGGGPGAERSYGAEAIGLCRLTVFPRTQPASSVLLDLRMRQLLVAALEAELAQILRAQMRLSRLSADEAVADFLVEITQNQTSDDIYDIAMTRRDIGDHLGVTLETISRQLNAFHRDGLIVLHSAHKFSVPDGSALFDLGAADRDMTAEQRRCNNGPGALRPPV
jgi:CRP-like cAMP-binding protein